MTAGTELSPAEICTSAPRTYEQIVTGARVYVVGHRAEQFPPPSQSLTGIYAGPAAASAPPGELTDVLKNGRALPNRRWSELSAIYKVWQEGPKSDSVGFCHYRRYFNFGRQRFQNNINPIDRSNLSDPGADLFDPVAVSAVDQRIAIVGKELFLGSTVYDHYAKCHNSRDYSQTFEIVALHRPEIAKYMAEQFGRATLFGSNLAILSWADFDDLCSFWFSVLARYAASAAWPRGDSYQDRDASFLAERLFDAWIRFKRDQGLVLQELPILFVR